MSKRIYEEELGKAVDNLAIALGMWTGTAEVTEVQIACYIESVLLLAKQSGLDRERALRPFDVHRAIAEKVWDSL